MPINRANGKYAVIINPDDTGCLGTNTTPPQRRNDLSNLSRSGTAATPPDYLKRLVRELNIPEEFGDAYVKLNRLTGGNNEQAITDVLNTANRMQDVNLALQVLRKQHANLTPEHQPIIARIIRDSGTATAGKQGYANEMIEMLGANLAPAAAAILDQIPRNNV